jgi:flagellar motor switch protein FliM
MTAARAWHLMLPRAAEEELGLALSVLSVSEATQPVPAALAGLPEDGLLLALRDPEGRGGLCCLDAGLLSAVIEVLTTGQVLPAAPTQRRPTTVDAALAGGVVDAAISAFDTAVAEMAERPPASGLRAEGHLADLRAAAMLLAEGPVQVTQVGVDLGQGARQGRLVVLAAPRKPRAGKARRPLAEDLRPAVMEGQVALQAVLHRAVLPLSRIRALAPGQVLPVPAGALGALSVEGGDGRSVAGARLGQVDGWKAVRLILSGPGAPPRITAAPLGLPELRGGRGDSAAGG